MLIIAAGRRETTQLHQHSLQRMFLLPVVLIAITAIAGVSFGERSVEFLNAGLLDDQHIVASFEELSKEQPADKNPAALSSCISSAGPWT